MNYFIQINSNGYIIATTSTASTLGAPWIAIPQTSVAIAQMSGATWDSATSAVVAPAANYNLSVVGNQRIAYLYGLLPALIVTPVAFTTAAGISTSFPNTGTTQQFLTRSLSAWNSADWPSTFFLLDVNNDAVILTFADATGLAKALGNAELAIQNQFITAKATILGYVNNGGTVAEIQAVVL